MPVKDLPAVLVPSSDYEKMEARIKKIFRELLYLPLMRELKDEGGKLANAATSALLDAIKSGRITHSRGVFSGRFSAAVSRELRQLGAKRIGANFALPVMSMPAELRQAIQRSEQRFNERLTSIEQKIRQNLPAEIAEKINLTDLFDTALFKVDKSIAQTLKTITVLPQLTPERRARISAEWQKNMELEIKEWADSEIVKLRKTVQDAAFAGNRYESLIAGIQKSYGVTANKARFLARQETNLLMTKFKEVRYVDAGVPEYRWGCVAGSKNHPVRPAHKALEGKIFRWDNPPITTEPGQPIRRNNPGQDFGCRCFAIPVVRF